MQRQRSVWDFTAFLTALTLVGIAFPSRAAGVGVSWMIDAGPFAGLQVQADASDGVVRRESNPLTLAAGRIVARPGTPSGNVFIDVRGVASPVVQLDTLSDEERGLSVALMEILAELQAAGRNSPLGPGIEAAAVELERAAEGIEHAQQEGRLVLTEAARAAIAGWLSSAVDTLLAARGARGDSPSLLDSAMGDTQRALVALRAGPAPQGRPSPLTITPDPLDFGEVSIGDQPELPTVVTNVSSKPVTFITRTKGLKDPFFGVVDGSRITLAPGQRVNLSVVFRPAEEGAFTDHFTVVSGALPGGSVQVKVKGKGVYPIKVQPSPVDFGGVLPGESKTMAVTLTNRATRRAKIDLKSVFNGFAVDPPQIADLPSGSSSTVNVTFTPRSVGSFQGQLALVTTINNQKPEKNIPLEGKGVQELGITGSLDFGKVARNKLHTRTLTLKNNGKRVLTGKADFSEVNRSFFTIIGDGEFTLNPGAERTITVLFFATGKCKHKDKASITSNGLSGGGTTVPVVARTVGRR